MSDFRFEDRNCHFRYPENRNFVMPFFQLDPLAAVQCTLAWWCECSLAEGLRLQSDFLHPVPHLSLQCPSFPLRYNCKSVTLPLQWAVCFAPTERLQPSSCLAISWALRFAFIGWEGRGHMLKTSLSCFYKFPFKPSFYSRISEISSSSNLWCICRSCIQIFSRRCISNTNIVGSSLALTINSWHQFIKAAASLPA